MRMPTHGLMANHLFLRARIINSIRRFFQSNRYLEIETPIRIPAPAPETHIDAVPSGNRYLHTSPEILMKRMMAAGLDRIFQICRCFRDGERGRKHLPEFTLLEWYRADADYHDLMEETEALIGSIAGEMGTGSLLTYQGHVIDLSPPWKRLSVEQAFDEYASVSLETALLNERFDEIMGLEIEPELGIGRPLFLFDYPAACGSLARVKSDRPNMVERFELYIAGVELCNAFTELTDPTEQRTRFSAERLAREKAGKDPYPMPEKFLTTLENMPECAGNALGIDRLVMLLADTDRIDDVVAFTPESL